MPALLNKIIHRIFEVQLHLNSQYIMNAIFIVEYEVGTSSVGGEEEGSGRGVAI